MIKDGKPYTCEKGHTDFELMSDGETMGHMSQKVFEAQVYAWIDRYILPAKRVNNMHNSYSLKHRLEHWATGGLYITNNQFKDAMMNRGFYPVDENELNWRYKIRISNIDDHGKVPPEEFIKGWF